MLNQLRINARQVTVGPRAGWLCLLLLALPLGPGSAGGQDGASGPPAKQPVPAEAQQQQTLAMVKEVFWKSYQEAKTSQQRKDVAKQILAQSSKTSKPAEQFVLLRVARDIAAREADYQTAFQAIDQLDRRFQINALEMKAAALEKTVPPPGRVREIAKERALAGLLLVEEALAADETELAERLIDVAMDEARKTREADLRRKVAAAQKKLRERLAQYEQFAAARAKLAEAPTDPAANGVVGAYYCFEKGDWDQGIPCLALADDEPVRAAAQQDLQAKTRAGSEVAVGNAWWDLSETADGTRRLAMQARAKCWYQRAVPSLDGLAALKVERRLSEIEDADLSRWLRPDEPDDGEPAMSIEIADAPESESPEPEVTGPPVPEGDWGGTKFGPFPNDLWDVRQGSRVLRHSGLTPDARPPYDIRALFGFDQPVSLVIFRRAPAGTVHFVEWQTRKPMTLRSFLFKAGHDADGGRAIARFRLFAQDVDTGKVVQVYDLAPAIPYVDTPTPQHAEIANHGRETFLLRVNVKPVTAQRFRAEFVQAAGGSPNPKGVRVMDLDGFEGFCPKLSHPE